MEESESDFEGDEENAGSSEVQQVWDLLTPEQKKYFKKLSQKSEENLRYIG